MGGLGFVQDVLVRGFSWGFLLFDFFYFKGDEANDFSIYFRTAFP